MASPPRYPAFRWWCDRTLVGLVAAIVAVDGLRGGYYAGVLGGGAGTTVAAAADWLPVLAVAALAVGLLAAAQRSPRHVGGVLVATPAVLAYVQTGLVLPWDQASYRVARWGLDAVLSVPVVGGGLAELLFGGHRLGRATLRRAFLVHYAILALAAVTPVVVLVRHGRGRRPSG